MGNTAESDKWYKEMFGEIYHLPSKETTARSRCDNTLLSFFGYKREELLDNEPCQKCLLLVSGPNPSLEANSKAAPGQDHCGTCNDFDKENCVLYGDYNGCPQAPG